MSKKTLDDLSLKHKTVLVRVDFNVPLDDEQNICDTTRIDLACNTIEYLLNHHARIILMSHLGRPKGKKDPKYSLAPCAKYLSQKLNRPVMLAPDCIGDTTKQMIDNMQDQDIILLENLRFYEAETKPEKDPSFAQKLASYSQFYVNDAFGTSHRKHSSTYEVAKLFADKSCMGKLVENEIKQLSSTIIDPKPPFCAIIGGVKVASKIGLLQSLLDKADKIFIGGAMAFSFLHLQGISLEKSYIDEEHLNEAKEFLKKAKQSTTKVFFPSDIVFAEKIEENSKQQVIETSSHPPKGWAGVDIGPETIKKWKQEIDSANTIFWNGPVGVFEINDFSKGTFAIAEFLSNLSSTTVVGGGDSLSAINQLNLSKKFTHLSSGGGATLTFIESGHLPGIDILSNKVL